MHVEEKNKIKTKSLLFVGSFLILMGITIFLLNWYKDNLVKNIEQDSIKEFYEEQKSQETFSSNEKQKETSNIPNDNERIKKGQKKISYIAVLKISKINLERGLVAKNSPANNVNQNIEILDESTSPEVDQGNVILAAHSGNSNIAYFRYLYKLVPKDEISIFYNCKEYIYGVVNIYDIPKTGTAEIIRNKNHNTLTLITCREKTNKQIIVISELKDIKEVR